MTETRSPGKTVAAPQQRRKTDIQSMFSCIAGRYDFANHFLSCGIDYYWRRVLVKQVIACQPRSVVDLATGSGDVAFALRRALPSSTPIKGMDFCAPMLEEAKKKQIAKRSTPEIAFEEGDCLDLPLSDATTDAVTIAFGFRNFEDRRRGLREMLRILQPGGSLFILEFSQPKTWVRPLYYFYLKRVLPTIAGVATGNVNAYHYLAGSIASFPDKSALSQDLLAAGFSEVNVTGLTFGTVAIHHAVRPG